MSKKLNVLVSFVEVDNAGELADVGDSYGFINYAFNYRDETDAQDIVINNPDGRCYNMAVASYYDMLDDYDDYAESLFRAVIDSQIHISDEETYTIVRKSRNTFLVKFYQEYEEDEDDEDDIIYINDKPYVDTDYREAFWFTDLKFTDKDITEPKEVEGKIWEAFEKYEEEYFEEY